MILLVTENENVAQAVEQECVVLGRQMLRAGTGAGALETSKSRMLDMVIIDQHLPDTAGDQLAVRLRNLHMELRDVVVFTRRHSKEEELTVRRTGVLLYAIVPEEQEEILNVMRKSVPGANLGGPSK